MSRPHLVDDYGGRDLVGGRPVLGTHGETVSFDARRRSAWALALMRDVVLQRGHLISISVTVPLSNSFPQLGQRMDSMVLIVSTAPAPAGVTGRP